MKSLSRLFTSFLTLILLASTVGSAQVTSAAGPPPNKSGPTNPLDKLHPMLRFAPDGGATVERVIVQKTTPGASAAHILPASLGNIVEEFDVVPAFVANVPAALLPVLAASPDVRYITPDAAVQVAPAKIKDALPKPPAKPKVDPKNPGVSPDNLLTTYPFDTGATSAWTATKPMTGFGVGIAVLDTGVDANHSDFTGRVTAINVNRRTQSAADTYGHGTHVLGIAGGLDPDGNYIGVAPLANLVSVKVADDEGVAYESDVLRGLEWVLRNGPAYHVRVVSMSLSTSIPTSYATSPIDAAVERLWASNVTVVASAGNLGSTQDAVWYAPGNDPRVITVGCLDDNATTSPADDSLCPISSRGVTEDGFAKPDVVAPGRKIDSPLATGPNGTSVELARDFPERITSDGQHLRLSGTSMSAPVVAGAAALLLQRNPGLTPDQMKELLMSTASRYPGEPDRAGAVNIVAALAGASNPPRVKQSPMAVGGTRSWSGTSTVLFDGSRWTSAYWDGSRWTGAYWDGSRWTGTTWDGSRWTSAYWDGSRWTSAYWDGSRWTAAGWDGSRWTSTAWDGSRWTSAAWDGSRWTTDRWD